MVYLIYGNQPYTIQHRFKTIAKDVLIEPDEMNYVKLDGREVTFQEIIDEATLTPLGYDRKVIVVEHCDFVIKETKTLLADKDYKEFLNYLANVDEMTTLILVAYSQEVDKKSNVVSIIEKKGKVLYVGPVTESQWLDYVYTLIEKSEAEIDRDAASELAVRTSGDVALLRNTVAKLVLYTKHITYADINLMVERPLENKSYEIYNHLIANDLGGALKVYRDIIVKDDETVAIISSLGNKFRLLHEIKYLVSQRMSVKDIALTLKIKEGQAAVISRQVYNFDEKKIRNTLNSLYELDFQIKSGQVDRLYAFELFLAKFNLD